MRYFAQTSSITEWLIFTTFSLWSFRSQSLSSLSLPLPSSFMSTVSRFIKVAKSASNLSLPFIITVLLHFLPAHMPSALGYISPKQPESIGNVLQEAFSTLYSNHCLLIAYFRAHALLDAFI